MTRCVFCGNHYQHLTRHLSSSVCGDALLPTEDEGASIGGLQQKDEDSSSFGGDIPDHVEVRNQVCHGLRGRRHNQGVSIEIQDLPSPGRRMDIQEEGEDLRHHLNRALRARSSPTMADVPCPDEELDCLLSLCEGCEEASSTAVPLTTANSNEATKTGVSWLQSVRSQSASIVVTPPDRAVAQIHHACDAAGAPRYLGDRILRIICHQMQQGFNPLNDHMTGRDSLMRRLSISTGLPKAESIDTTLESGTPTSIYRFPFRDMLQNHLLSDVYGNIENLHVDTDDPWIPYSSQSTTPCQEMHDGTWFQDTVAMYEEAGLSNKGYLIHPLVIYTDKTGTDKVEKNSLEPVMVTSSIIRGSARESAQNWFPLGLVPNLSLHSSAARRLTKGRKKSRSQMPRDYHRCLSILLEPLKELQRKRPVMRIRRGDTIRTYRILCPVIGIVGDNLALDHICGRMGSYGPKCPRLSRRCMTSFEEADNSPHSCTPVDSQHIEKLSMGALGCHYGQVTLHGEIGDFQHSIPSIPPSPHFDWWVDHLNKLPAGRKKAQIQARERREKICDEVLHKVYCSHSVDNAFWGVDFGATVGGVHRAALSDILHTVEEGLIPNILEVVFGSLTTKQRTDVDSLVESLFGAAYNRSGERHLFPRVSFTRGYSQLTLLSADERVGQLFVLALLLQMENGRRLLEARFDIGFDELRAQRSNRLLSSRKRDVDGGAKTTGLISTEDEEDPNREDANMLTEEEIKEFLRDIDLGYMTSDILPRLPRFHQSLLMDTLQKTITPQWRAGVQGNHLPKGCLDYREVRSTSTEDRGRDYQVEIGRRISASTRRKFHCRPERSNCSMRLDMEEFKYVVETVLTMHSFLKYGHPEKPFSDVREGFELAMDFLREVVVSGIQRGDGTNQWKLQKFLELSHFGGDWVSHGPPSGYSTSGGERGLKTWAKHPSITAQKRDDKTFSGQVMDRIHESMVLQAVVGLDDTPPEYSMSEETGTRSAGGRFVFCKSPNHERNGFCAILPSGKVVTNSVQFPEVVEEWFAARYQDMVDVTVQIFTEVRIVDDQTREKTIIRAHPCYQKKGPWFDFALLRYETGEDQYEHFPCRCVCFFQESPTSADSSIQALIQESEYQTPRQKAAKSQLLTHWSLRATLGAGGLRKAMLSVVNVDTIDDRILAFETDVGLLKRESGKKFDILWMKYRESEWPQSFLSSPSQLPERRGSKPTKSRRQRQRR